jgi:predicted regulator of Ras-like GTPase activity (Roadblock/LC7/MglB family)
MRIMVMTFMGEALPREVKELNLNGTLTKPFFVGDLPDLIGQALGQRAAASSRVVPPPAPAPATPVKVNSPVPAKNDPAPPSPPVVAKTAPPAPPSPPATPAEAAVPVLTPISPVPQETIRFLRANETEIVRLLDDLNREVRAEAILLIAGAELIAQAGMLSRAQCRELTALISQSAQAAALAARFLGERAGRFGQSLHEGSEVRLYSLSLGEGISLSLALNSNVPLGMIRHQCRQTADRLTKFII